MISSVGVINKMELHINIWHEIRHISETSVVILIADHWILACTFSGDRALTANRVLYTCRLPLSWYAVKNDSSLPQYRLVWNNQNSYFLPAAASLSTRLYWWTCLCPLFSWNKILMNALYCAFLPWFWPIPF